MTTYSLFSDAALANTPLSVPSSNASCKMPVVSRRSAKITPPRSRLLAMEPATTTVSPTRAGVSSPQ